MDPSAAPMSETRLVSIFVLVSAMIRPRRPRGGHERSDPVAPWPSDPRRKRIRKWRRPFCTKSKRRWGGVVRVRTLTSTVSRALCGDPIGGAPTRVYPSSSALAGRAAELEPPQHIARALRQSFEPYQGRVLLPAVVTFVLAGQVCCKELRSAIDADCPDRPAP
jgi:hypothetical protein